MKPITRTAHLRIRLAPKEKRQIVRSAARRGVRLSAWVRHVLLSAAGR